MLTTFWRSQLRGRDRRESLLRVCIYAARAKNSLNLLLSSTDVRLSRAMQPNATIIGRTTEDVGSRDIPEAKQHYSSVIVVGRDTIWIRLALVAALLAQESSYQGCQVWLLLKAGGGKIFELATFKINNYRQTRQIHSILQLHGIIRCSTPLMIHTMCNGHPHHVYLQGRMQPPSCNRRNSFNRNTWLIPWNVSFYISLLRKVIRWKQMFYCGSMMT